MDDFQKGRTLVFLQFALLLVIAIFPDSANVPSWATSVGMVLIGLGVIVTFMGFRGLGKSLTANPVSSKEGTLVTTGIYSRMRHPIYAGLLAITLGLVVSSGVLTQIVIWAALALLLTYKSRWEEVMLAAKYKGYAEYKTRVPAIFPRLTK